MDSRQLSELKAALKQIIADGDTGKAIEQLRQTIPAHSGKYNILVQLGRQFNELRQAEIKHTLGFDVIFNRQSALTDNVLGLIDMLSEEDFSIPSASGAAERKARMGSVLYAIPPTMELSKEKQCVVRLAFDEAYLLDNFLQGHDTHIRSLRRIDERMEVELLDPNEEKSFAIRTISTVQQKVEKDDYTEWIYYVKPLKEGKFPLCLKVSVIILEEGEKVRKEIVLQEIIEVVSNMTEDAAAGLEMRHSGLIYSFGFPLPVAPDMSDSTNPDPGTSQTNLPDPSHQLGGAVSKGLLKTAVASMTKIAAGVATLVTAGGIIYYTTTGQNAGSDTPLTAETQNVKLNVAPPFSDTRINVAPSVHIVQPDKPTVLTLLTGARITIPASVFVTLDNRPVTKPVEIRFREFHKPAEIIAGGIPMRVFDAQGREQWMQTAGMFEVEGFSEGQAVKIAQGKAIMVEIASETGDNCDFWYFNTDTGNWDNLGARPAQRDSLQPQKTSEDDAAKGISKSLRQPLKPQLVNKDKPVLDFDINYDALPELKNVGNILWQYAGDNPEEDPANNRAILEQQWDYVKVEPSAQAGVFQMVLTKGKDKLTLPVKACSNKANYEKAMADYRENYKKYEAKREKAMERAAFREEQEDFVRSMSVGRFGIYNWDYILKRDDAVPVLADFDFGAGLPADIKKEVKVCLITGAGRSVISFTQDQWRNFTFSPGMDNKLVAILPGNRVATFSQEDFNREKAAIQQARGKRYVFKMNVLPQSVSSAAELEKVTG